MSQSQGILVLGMHRTGTSLVASLLARLGFEVPGEAVPPGAANPRGYFEPRSVVEAHEEFLHEAGRTWDDGRPLGGALFSDGAAVATRERLRAIVRRDVVPRGRWVIKDPRMCRLLPLWQGLLEEEGVEHRVLHVTRAPWAVAASLRARDGLRGSQSQLLWLRHNLEAEAATRGTTRAWVRFEDVTTDSGDGRRRLRQALSQLGIRWASARAALDDVLDERLVHHADEPPRECGVHPWIEEAHRALAGHSVAIDSPALDALRARLATADDLLAGDGMPPPCSRPGTSWLHDEIARARRSIESNRDVLGSHTVAVERLAESLVAQREELRDVPTISRRLEALEGALVERLEERHVALLGRSLDALGRLERQLDTCRAEVTEAARERDELRARCHEIDRDLDRACHERDDARAALARTELTASLARLEAETRAEESRGARAQVEQMRARRSWRYTSGLRRLYRLVASGSAPA